MSSHECFPVRNDQQSNSDSVVVLVEAECLSGLCFPLCRFRTNFHLLLHCLLMSSRSYSTLHRAHIARLICRCRIPLSYLANFWPSLPALDNDRFRMHLRWWMPLLKIGGQAYKANIWHVLACTGIKHANALAQFMPVHWHILCQCNGMCHANLMA